MSRNRELETMVKLSAMTKEYLMLEREKKDFALEKSSKDLLDRTAVHTLYLMQCRLDTLTKQIITLVERCQTNDYDLDNEVAVTIYNYYTPLIRRGLFTFDF